MVDEIRRRVLAVVGQGYVGLPLSMRAVEGGFEVIGFDVDKERADRLRNGLTYIDDVKDADIAAALATGRFRPSSKNTPGCW